MERRRRKRYLKKDKNFFWPAGRGASLIRKRFRINKGVYFKVL